MDSHLQDLEEKSIYILREAKARFKRVAILWSMGKDSTTMLYLCKKAFFGRIPFSAIHIDNGHDFPETYEFRNRISKEWKVKLSIAKAEYKKDNISNTTEGLNKAKALKRIMLEKRFDALIVSIRRDEHGIRAKERYFSARDKDFRWDYLNQPPEVWNHFSEYNDASHTRIHPLLEWTELDVWQCIKEKSIPINPLYFAKDGKRYRSIGYPECTVPIESNAKNVDEIIEELKKTRVSEKAGRAQDKEKEYVMQRLRALGYM